MRRAVFDARLTVTAHGRRLEQTLVVDGEDDHIVNKAVDLVAAAHVADGHSTGIDHAEPFVAQGRLSDLAQAAQSIQSICTAAAVSTWTAAMEPRS